MFARPFLSFFFCPAIEREELDRRLECVYICSIISRNYFGVWDTQNRRAADAAWRNTIHQLNLRLFLAGWMDGWIFLLPPLLIFFQRPIGSPTDGPPPFFFLLPLHHS